MTPDPNNEGFYFISSYHAIYWTYNFRNFSHLAGIYQSTGYETGVSAKFGRLTGIIAFEKNRKTILVADYTYHCIHEVDLGEQYISLSDNNVAEFAGKCQVARSIDGSISEAGITSPTDLIFENENSFVFSEVSTVRRLLLENGDWKITTLTDTGYNINKIAFDPFKATVFITHTSRISRLSTNGLTIISGQNSGYRDGSLNESEFNDPQQIAFLSDRVFVVADRQNHVLRIVNLADQTVSTVCQPKSLNYADPCQMEYPTLLYTDLDGLHVIDANAVISMSLKYNQCKQ